MKAVDFCYFSGTGNTLLVARHMAEVFLRAQIPVGLRPIERTSPATVGAAGATVGLAFPVAAFSTYPLVWRFIEALPQGQNTPVFMVDTLGGFSGLMVGPLRQLLAQKGYRPVGARQIVMPGNYLFVKPREACEKRIAKGLRQAERYAEELLDGTARWRRLSPIPYRWVHSFWEKVERSANRDGLRFKVNEITCTKCGLCSRLCPVGNIAMKEFPRFGGACQQCQRCIAYCPARAISHSALANGRYHAVPAADLLTPP